MVRPQVEKTFDAQGNTFSERRNKHECGLAFIRLRKPFLLTATVRLRDVWLKVEQTKIP